MPAMGFAEVLMLALLSSGLTNTDLVAFIQPKHYFESRQIEVSIAKMVDLAGTDPKDAKAQVMQLTALRHLTEESESFKKSPRYADYRQQLQQIAEGKRAQDSLGFAREYAAKLLAKLDGTKLALGKVPLLREQALAWFPAESTFVAAMDLRQVKHLAGPADPFGELRKLMPDEAKKEMYQVIEKAGNVRIERYAMAWADHKERDKQKIMMRVTGKANQAWLAEMFRTMPHSRFQTKEMKDAKGTPIVILQQPKRAPIIALIGNTDVVVVGYEKDDGKHEEIWDTILAVREKKQASVAAGALKKQLARVPDKAIGMVVGNVPEEMKRELRRGLDAAPNRVFGYVVRDILGLDVNLEATMANTEDADKLVAKVGALRKQGIAALQQAQQKPLPPGSPPVPFQALINLMESLQVNSQGDTAQLRLLVPEALLQQMGLMGWMFF